MAEQTVKIDGVTAVAGTLPVSGTVASAPSGIQDVNIVSPATVPVSGTVTALPSGTQAVSGTVTTTPSGTQTVSGTVTALPSGTQAVSGTVTSVPGVPAGYNFYLHSLSSAVGVVAGNNFLSVFNPVGSGKTIVFYQSIIQSFATAAASSAASMDTFRTSAASAGTLIAAANINKFATSQPNSIAEVRVGNPTVTTVGTTTLGVAPAVTSSGAGVSAGAGGNPPPGATFVCLPGEGLVMRTSAGDVDQLWNLTFVWAEF